MQLGRQQHCTEGIPREDMQTCALLNVRLESNGTVSLGQHQNGVSVSQADFQGGTTAAIESGWEMGVGVLSVITSTDMSGAPAGWRPRLYG